MILKSYLTSGIRQAAIPGMDDIKVSYMPDLVIKYAYLEHRKPRNLKIVKFAGNTFPVHITNSFVYFHFLVDNMFQYIFLREHIKDLKLVLLCDPDVGGWRWNLTLDFIKLFNIPNENIIFIEENEYQFENVATIFFYHNLALRNLVLKPDNFNPWEYDFPIDSTPHQNFFVTARNKILNYALKHININSDTQDKIFISRKARNKEIGPNTDRKTFSIQEQEAIEDFFSGYGYRIVNPEEHTFLEQLEIFYNAKVVVGFKGTNILNTIFCRPGTRVVVLNTDNSYFMYYDYLAYYFNLTYSELPQIDSRYAKPKKEIANYEDYSIEYLIGLIKQKRSILR